MLAKKSKRKRLKFSGQAMAVKRRMELALERIYPTSYQRAKNLPQPDL